MRLDWLDDGTGRLTWWDLHVIVKNSPIDCAWMRAMFPELATVQLELVRAVEYAARAAVWDHKANGDPEPLRLPWEPKKPTAHDVLDWSDVTLMPGMERYAALFN